MGKKSTRTKYTSKGARRNVANGVTAERRARSAITKMLNKIKAWKAGKNPWITVSGVKVKSNTLYGNPKKTSYGPNGGGQ